MRILPITTLLLLALPAPLCAQAEWSTFFGDSGNDHVVAMTTDALGRIYVCGRTNAVAPVSANAYQVGSAGAQDAVVACFDPSLPSAQQLVWATHFGGTANETALDVHVDAAGTRVTIVGFTESTDLPTLGAWQPQSGGGRDGFVATFDPSLTGAAQLLAATYLGGSGEDRVTSVDGFGGVTVVAGITESSDLPTANAFQSNRAGGRDLFVCSLPDLSSPLFCTYLGGAGDDGLDVFNSNPFGARAAQLVGNAAGEVTVTSTCSSPDFPLLGSTGHGPHGFADVTVSRFDVAGTMTFSTVIGGSNDEVLREVSTDGADRIVLSGMTRSSNLPVTANNLQPLAGIWDGMVLHFDIASDQLLYGTHIGGTVEDFVMAAYRESSGTFVLVGHARGGTFQATPGAPDTQGPNNFALGYLARLTPDATSSTLDYMTWFGGSTNQTILQAAPDGRGGAIIAGVTISPDFPVTANAFDPTFDGVRDGFVAVHPMLPAAVSRFGTSSNDCPQPSYLQVNSAPLPGNAAFAVEAHDAPSNAIGVMAFGAPLPAGIGALGVDIFVAPPAITTMLVADGTGFASQPVSIPAGYAWNGALAMQSFWLSPTSCTGGFLTTSNALR